MVHHNDCFLSYRRNGGIDDADTGYHERLDDFQARFNIQLNFEVGCLGCCLGYLIHERNYVMRENAQFRRVCFERQLGGAEPEDEVDEDDESERSLGGGAGDLVNVFAHSPSGGGRRGQIKTNKDLNIGTPAVRCFQNSRTYQLYSPELNGSISVGYPATARLECIAIETVKTRELTKVYCQYADAVFIERYREVNGLRSLSFVPCDGICYLDQFNTEHAAH